MTPQKRQLVLTGVLLVMLAAAAVWNLNWMAARRSDARDAATRLAACEKLVADIEQLRADAEATPDAAAGVRELGERIDAAKRRADLGPKAIDRVSYPRSVQPVPGLPYVRKPTEVALRDVSLLQLGIFLYHVTGDSGLSVSELRLRSPHGDAPRDVWDAEVTLTRLAYAPSEEGARD